MELLYKKTTPLHKEVKQIFPLGCDRCTAGSVAPVCYTQAMHSATARSHPNIALIKYWGNRDDALRLPENGSISMTLGGLETRTTVTFDRSMRADVLYLNGRRVSGEPSERVSAHLGRIREAAGVSSCARIESQNNFPTGAGIASSASAFASLTVAGCAAAGLELDPRGLSRLARLASGSACRSIFGGYVEWYAADSDEGSYAKMLAPPEHWQLVDFIAIVSQEHKSVGSTQGHLLAGTSPLQSARVQDAPRRLSSCREALLARDFESLATVVEQDSNLMHAVMITSQPPLVYWEPGTLEVLRAVPSWRREGLSVCYTVDAGPNVHCLCTLDDAEAVEARLKAHPGLTTLVRAEPGGPTRLV